MTPEFKPFTYHNWNFLFVFLWKFFFFFNCVVLIQTHCCFSPFRYVTHIPVYCIFLWLLPTLFLLVVLGSEVEADYLLCPFITRKPRWTEHVTDFWLDVQVKGLLFISFSLTYIYSRAQKWCMRKKLLGSKNTQATARREGAIFLQFTHENFEKQAVKKSLRQEARKLPLASRRHKKFFDS